MNPRGIERGKPVTLTLGGLEIGRADLKVLTNLPGTIGGFKVEHANKVTAPLLVPADAPIGAYYIQVQTAMGLSPRVLISLSDRPEADEREPNDEPTQAQAAGLPVTINGSCSGSDRDCYKVALKRGERLYAEVEARRLGSGLDPALTILNARGIEVAADADAFALPAGDRAIVFEAPDNGEYTVSLCDARYSGGGDPVYRLKLAVGPVVEEVFPLGCRRGAAIELTYFGSGVAQPIKSKVSVPSDPGLAWINVSPPAPAVGGPFRLPLGDRPEELEPAAPNPKTWTPGSVMNGRLGAPGETDVYVLKVHPGRLVLDVEAANFGSRLDGVLKASLPNGTTLAEADDGGSGPDPSLELNIPAGATEILVTVRDLLQAGGVGFGYRLKTREESPDYQLAVASAAVNIPTTGIAIVPVQVLRRNFNEAIQLTIPAELEGVTASGGLIPANAAAGSLILSAKPGADPGLVPLEILGSAGPPAQPIVRKARLVRDGTPLPPQHTGALVAAISQGPPFAVSLAETAVEFVHGGTIKLTVKANRLAGYQGPIAISTQGLPGGIAGGSGSIAAGASDLTLEYKVDPVTPLVGAELRLIAKAAVNTREETTLLKPIPAQVVRPFSFELLTAAATVPQGGKTTIVGVVKRVASFRQEVRIASAGSVPASVAITPITAAPDVSVVQIEISAAADAKPGSADILIRAAGDIEGRKQTKDYLVPDQTLKLTVSAAPAPPPVASATPSGPK